jgi:hypothetical protein
MTAKQTEPKAAAATQPGKSGTISNADAVRKAKAELGKNATREGIQAFAKERYGLDLTSKYVTDTLSKDRVKAKKKRKKAKKAATPPAAKAATPAVQPPSAAAKPAHTTGNGQPVLIEDLKAVRKLVRRVGPDKLRRLIDVLSS